MNAASVAVWHEETSTGVSGVKSTRRRSQRRSNHWIFLDSAWAKLLGVRKTAGVYQIPSNELQLKLLLMREAPGSSAPTPTRPGTNNDGRRLDTPSDKPLPIPPGQTGRVKPDRPPLLKAS
jgi:hypothetical protein